MSDTTVVAVGENFTRVVATGTIGPPGPPGTDGADGVDGTDGSDGADGVDGSDGADGATGPPGLTNRGTWSNVTAYVVNDVVSYLGSSFVSILAGTNHVPVVGGTSYWQDLADKGDTGATGDTGDTGDTGATGARGIGVATFSVIGTIAITPGTMRYSLIGSATITSVVITAGTAPTGASIKVDVNKNGTTVFTTQANRPEIAISGHVSGEQVPDVTSLSDGDYLTVDIDQIGSTIPGGDLVVEVWLS